MFNPLKLLKGIITKGSRSQALAKILGWLWAGSEIVHSNGIKDAESLLAALKVLGMGWLSSLLIEKWQAHKAVDNETRLNIARAEIERAGLTEFSGRLEPRHYH